MSASPHTLSNHLTYQQVEQVIHLFYQQIIVHPQIGHYFSHIDDFTEHEQRISEFWWTVLGGQLPQPPKINMIDKHKSLGIQQTDLDIWLSVLSSTLKQQLNVQQAEQWNKKAQQIAERLKQMVIEKRSAGLQIGEPASPQKMHDFDAK